MELLEGEPLDDRIRREGRLSLAEVLRIGLESAQGLAAAHARRLVHRDIKPANLWLEGPTGHVKVLDFGLARAPADQVHLTTMGMIVGTPAYMAPEQAEGKPVDPRCDLFSLGCVLYQMSTGTLPFHGESTIAVLRALALHEPLPLGKVRPEAPQGLSALVTQLLAKKPEDRPASAQEVAETLRGLEQLPTTQVLPAQVPPAQRTSPARKRRRPLAAVAGAALAAAVLAVVVILWPTPRGTVRIESDDATVEVVFDKDGPTIKGADKEPITLRAGEHGILIRRGDFTFEADKLVLKKGAALTLKVELLRGKVQVMQDGKVMTTQDIPPQGPALAKAPFDFQQARGHQEAWAKYLGVPVEYTNKLGMKFRLIPPGEFTMGVTDAEAEAWTKFHQDPQDGGKRAAPAHSVRLTRPFYLAEREVRYAEFLDLVKREPGDEPKHVNNAPDGLLLSNCTWFDCIAFCNRLSEREGLTPAYKVEGQEVTVIPGATGYRLPTEAEWEFACRAGTTSLWYFGLTAQEARAMCDRSVPEGQVYLRHRVGGANPFGLLGMYAGASEWCWDWYDAGYYRKCADHGVVVDPQGPESGETRITRGGTRFSIDSADLATINSAARNPQHTIKAVAFNWNGFGRVVLPISAKGADPLAGWIQEVAALPVEEQVKAVAAKLRGFNPGFDGQVTPHIDGGVVSGLNVRGGQMRNLAPVRALTDLRSLDCYGAGSNTEGLIDLAPLRGMKLEQLACHFNPVTDLSPVRDLPLRDLNCGFTRITDLTPLKGMKLEQLYFTDTEVSDLAPLKDMPLTTLDCSRTRVSDLTPLKGMSLKWLKCESIPVTDLTPLKDMPIERLWIRDIQAGLSPLRGMPLRELECDFRAERDAAILRSIKTLEKINGKPAEEFWKEVDAKPEAQQP
jgi:formylglycine-generating enzyme required for sulfatase activity